MTPGMIRLGRIAANMTERLVRGRLLAVVRDA